MAETDPREQVTHALIRYLESASSYDGLRDHIPATRGPDASWSMPRVPSSSVGIETPMAMAGTPRIREPLRWTWRVVAFALGILLGAIAMWTALALPVARFAVAAEHRVDHASVATADR